MCAEECRSGIKQCLEFALKFIRKKEQERTRLNKYCTPSVIIESGVDCGALMK
jgi:hypothetical protein